MTYPVVVFIIAILAVVGMLLFIVPIFEEHVRRPRRRRCRRRPGSLIVAVDGPMKFVAPFVVVAVIVVVRPLALGSSTTTGCATSSTRSSSRCRSSAALFHKIALARFSRNLGTLIRSGVPILQALEIVAETTRQRGHRPGHPRRRRTACAAGESLASPLAEHAVFPPMVVQMMAVGEETGALDTMLHKIADFYDQEVEATTEALTSLIEPLMIAVMGGIVGVMIIALYMPIFKVFELIK